MILFENVTKVYEPDVNALDSRHLRDRQGRVRLHRRRVGLGQDDALRLLLKELEPTDGRIVSAAATSAG